MASTCGKATRINRRSATSPIGKLLRTEELKHSKLLEFNGELGATANNGVVRDGNTSINQRNARLPTHNRMLES